MAVNAFAWLRPDRLLGMALPMGLWALHFVFVYSLAGLGCEHDWHRQRFAGVNVLSLGLILATIVALVPIVLLGLRAWRLHQSSLGDVDPTVRRARFLGLLTTVLAALAAIAVLFTATPILMLPPCTA